MALLDAIRARPNSQRVRDWSADRLRLGPGDLILDLGCGTGTDLIDAASVVAPDGVAVGLDVSWTIIAEARRRTAAAAGVAVVQGAGETLPFRSEVFAGCRLERVLLRTHHLTIQVFDDGLARREPIDVVVSGTATPVPATAGRDAALVVLNAPPRTYAKVRLDTRSRATLAGCLGALDDDVRAVCWVAGVEMVRDGLMPIAELRAWVDDFASSEPDPEVRELLLAAVER